MLCSTKLVHCTVLAEKLEFPVSFQSRLTAYAMVLRLENPKCHRVYDLQMNFFHLNLVTRHKKSVIQYNCYSFFVCIPSR